jgi:cytochrome P450
MSLFICIALAFSSLLILWLSSTYLQRSYFLQYTSTRNGCAPPRSLPSKDLFFGLDTFFAAMKAMNNHCRMRTIQAQTRIYGRTFQSFPFNRRVITITSARNIQHVLSHEHEKFGVSPIRGPSVAMTGPGIITNDGKVWEHARAMIRPSFARSLVADRDMFDVHVEHFLGLLPELGATVDLQPLFDRLVCQMNRLYCFKLLLTVDRS